MPRTHHRLGRAGVRGARSAMRAAAQIRLTSFDGRPVYRFGGGGGGAGGRGDRLRRRRHASSARWTRPWSIARPRAWAGRPLREATKELVEDVDQWTVVGAPANHAPALQVLVARRTAGLRQRRHRRSGAVHHHVVAFLGVSRRDSALALLHAAPEAPAGVVLVRRLVVAHRHRRGADRRRRSPSGCTRRGSAIGTPACRPAFRIEGGSAGTRSSA